MKVAIGGDHAGWNLKNRLAEMVRASGHAVLDLGAARHDPEDDYPDFAALVGRAVADGKAERGLLVCGSGVGAAVAANKIRGVRAGLCHDTYSAHQGVEHDDVNVLCLGARIVGEALAAEIVQAFLAARFTNEPRHARRLKKILDLEKPPGA
jgi:ribose 5-phosphate isomerase B